MRVFVSFSMLLILSYSYVSHASEGVKYAETICLNQGHIKGQAKYAKCVLNFIKDNKNKILIEKQNKNFLQKKDELIIRQAEEIQSKSNTAGFENSLLKFFTGVTAAAITQGMIEGVNNLSSNPPPASTPNCTVNCSPPSVIDLQNYGVLPTPQAIGNVSGGIR